MVRDFSKQSMCNYWTSDLTLSVYYTCIKRQEKDVKVLGKMCGNLSEIFLGGKADKNSTELNISIPFNQSCFYRVETECGWPMLSLNTSGLDVAAAAVDMTGIERDYEFVQPSYVFRDNETYTTNMVKLQELRKTD